MWGTTATSITSANTIEKEIHERSLDPSPRPVANSGASASGANFAAPASAINAPRAGVEVSPSSAYTRNIAISVSLPFVISGNSV